MQEPSQHQACVLGCSTPVPAELESERVCVLHFIFSVEQACAEMRRETALRRASARRQAEIANYIATAAVKLAHVATGNVRLSDDLKKRVLTTFLTLMNLRENLDRAAKHSVPELRTLRAAAASASAVAPS